jgi:F0F1-type ATP synthase assembly protein I
MFSKLKSRRKPDDKQQEKRRTKHREVKLLGGLAAGVLGGIVATWVLDKYQQGAIEATRRMEDAANTEPVFSRQQEEHLREQQRAHAEAAQRIAKSATGRKLSRAQQQTAAPIVHYAAGALAGGVYGLTSEILPGIRRWYGMGYSKFIFLGASEPLLPWLGLTPRQKAQVTPAGLPAPLIFGAVLETTRRAVRWML